MKGHIYRIGLPFLLLLLFSVTVLSSVVFAEDTVINATIPVSVFVKLEEKASGEAPKETYTFILESLNDAPMPEDSTLHITGVGSAQFTVSYDQIGVYEYRITQDTSALTDEVSPYHDRGRYDQSVYYIRVTVTNTEHNSLGVVVSAHKGSYSADKTEIEYTNSYSGPNNSDMTPTPSEMIPTPTDHKTPTATGGGKSTAKKGTTSSKKFSLSTPKTGDGGNVIPWLILLIVSVLAIGFVMIRRNKKNRKD